MTAGSSTGPADASTADDESDDGPDAPSDRAVGGDQHSASESPAEASEDGPDDQPPATGGDTAEPEATAPSEPAPVTVDDPCAGHENRTSDVFIEFAAPVDGQQVGPAIELVGCANTFEAAVRYRLTQGGAVLVDSFTTADCGHGFCVGEYSDSVDASGASPGALLMEVSWDHASDGSERDLAQLNLVMP